MKRSSHTTFSVKRTMETAEQLGHLTSPHLKVAIKETWDTMGSTDSEAVVSMPVSIPSETDLRFYFSSHKSQLTGTGYSLGSAEDEHELYDIKTEIKSELTIDENEPLGLARWLVDPLDVILKEETQEVSGSGSDGQEDIETSFNVLHEESLQEIHGAKCHTEVLMLSEPKKSHQEGRVCHVLSYRPKPKAAVREADEPETHPESSGERLRLCEKSNNAVREKPCDRTKRSQSSGTRKSKKKRKGEGQEEHCCSLCGKHFANVTNLRVHMRIHTGEKPYVCRTCGEAFARSDYLLHHTRVHTDQQLITPRPCKQRLKRFACSHCDKTFNRACGLRDHMRGHTQERPFTCFICDKGFLLAVHLKRHTQSHVDTRPFVCSECGHSFNRQGTLEKHQRIHTGVKPYKCAECGKAFRYKYSVTLHMKVHDKLG